MKPLWIMTIMLAGLLTLSCKKNHDDSLTPPTPEQLLKGNWSILSTGPRFTLQRDTFPGIVRLMINDSVYVEMSNSTESIIRNSLYVLVVDQSPNLNKSMYLDLRSGPVYEARLYGRDSLYLRDTASNGLTRIFKRATPM